jgi:hypothetical protein
VGSSQDFTHAVTHSGRERAGGELQILRVSAEAANYWNQPVQSTMACEVKEAKNQPLEDRVVHYHDLFLERIAVYLFHKPVKNHLRAKREAANFDSG